MAVKKIIKSKEIEEPVKDPNVKTDSNVTNAGKILDPEFEKFRQKNRNWRL